MNHFIPNKNKVKHLNYEQIIFNLKTLQCMIVVKIVLSRLLINISL